MRRLICGYWGSTAYNNETYAAAHENAKYCWLRAPATIEWPRRGRPLLAVVSFSDGSKLLLRRQLLISPGNGGQGATAFLASTVTVAGHPALKTPADCVRAQMASAAFRHALDILENLTDARIIEDECLEDANGVRRHIRGATRGTY